MTKILLAWDRPHFTQEDRDLLIRMLEAGVGGAVWTGGVIRLYAYVAAALVGTFPPNDPRYPLQRWHYEQIALPAAM